MKINVGCGSVYNRGGEWLNLDLHPSGPSVVACDLRRGIPAESNSADLVYLSHVLEHLDPQPGLDLLRECYRVLKPGGIVRVVVPDLEEIARRYLAATQQAWTGGDDFRYDWSKLELFDQLVRSQPGGRLREAILSANGEQRILVEERLGAEARAIWQPNSVEGTGTHSLWRTLRSGVARARRWATAGAWGLLFGRQGWRWARAALFRELSGEIHREMYDRVSLRRVMTRAGFVEFAVVSAVDSSDPAFASYDLDFAEGRPRKPDSIYAEARKPAR